MSDIAKFQTLMIVLLGTKHLSPGRTRHAIVDTHGHREFPPFIRLEIAQYPGDPSYYLLHICKDGQTADTNHATLNEAMHQAEWEFGVQQHEWQVVQRN